MSILTISDKVVIGGKVITRDIEGYDDKNANTSKNHSTLVHVCIKEQNCKLYEAKTDRSERRIRQNYNYNSRFQRSFLNS